MRERYDILLIEDNPSDAELIIWALNKNKISDSLLHLADSEEAINYIFAMGTYEKRNVQDLPKLILLDLKMPKISGLEVLKRLKADERTKTVPVILLTSSKEDKDIEISYQLGVNSYIVKPVEFKDFENVISRMGTYWSIINQSPK
jgi:two-component system response regulator